MKRKKKKTPQILTFFTPIFNIVQKLASKFLTDFSKFDQQYPLVILKIQLLFLYLFAFSSFFYTTCSQLYSISPNLEFIPFFVQDLIQIPIVQFLFSPQRSFFLYLLTTEYIVINPILGFSKFLKYHVLYIIVLQMVQNLALSYLDLILHQSPEFPGEESDYDIDLSERLFYALFFYFFIVLSNSFLMAMRNKFTQFPGLEWLTDSVCFWLKIKSPGLRKFFDDPNINK